MVTPLYKPYGYVPHQRLEFLRHFGPITCIDLANFGLLSGMAFEKTSGL